MDKDSMRRVYNILKLAGPDGLTRGDVVRLVNMSSDISGDSLTPPLDVDTVQLALWALGIVKKAIYVPDKHGNEIHLRIAEGSENGVRSANFLRPGRGVAVSTGARRKAGDTGRRRDARGTGPAA